MHNFISNKARPPHGHHKEDAARANPQSNMRTRITPQLKVKPHGNPRLDFNLANQTLTNRTELLIPAHLQLAIQLSIRRSINPDLIPKRRILTKPVTIRKNPPLIGNQRDNLTSFENIKSVL